MTEVLLYIDLGLTAVLGVALVAISVGLKLHTLTLTRSAEFRDAVRVAVSEQIHELKARQDALESSTEARHKAIEASWSDWYQKNQKLANRQRRQQNLDDERESADGSHPDLSGYLARVGQNVENGDNSDAARDRRRDAIARAAHR